MINQFRKPDPQKEKKKSFLSHVFSYKFDINVENDVVFRYVPYFVFLTFLGIIYIASSYHSEKQLNRMAVLEKQVSKLRVDYGSLKYEYIFASKKAEIAKKVKAFGLEENDEPVMLIEE